jgi:gliding motility associated protien GldN
MKHIKYFLVFILFVFFTKSSFAQQSVFQPGDYKDAIYEKENAVNIRYIPYSFLREGDVTWEKRVWRRLDMREKMNQSLYYPKDAVEGRISLPQLVIKYILSGQIVAFEDEEFKVYFEKAFIKSKLVIQGDSADVEKFAEDGSPYNVRVAGSIDSTWFFETFSSLSIKEDWFFDKQKSSLEVRILGLGFNAPIKGKEDLGEVNQFWVYFPACRPFFSKHEVFNVKNDSERRTFEAIFWKRQFASNVTKESNVYDRKIDQYAKGIEALIESDRVKSDIFRFEHDLWQF